MEPTVTLSEELSAIEKSSVRTTVFNHLAGIVIAPVAKALADRGIFALLGDARHGVTIDQIADRTGGSRGAM